MQYHYGWRAGTYGAVRMVGDEKDEKEERKEKYRKIKEPDGFTCLL